LLKDFVEKVVFRLIQKKKKKFGQNAEVLPIGISLTMKKFLKIPKDKNLTKTNRGFANK
jgi:hypothetical protein